MVDIPASNVIGFKEVSLKKETFQRHRLRIKEILLSDKKGEDFIGQQVVICGWTRTIRQQQKDTLAFISLNDGSCFDSIQIVASKEDTKCFEDVLTCGGIGSSMRVIGEVVESPNKKTQSVEVKATEIQILGTVDPIKYPLKKTKHAHSFEFLRENAHLRCRTNLIGAVQRVRNALAFATHSFFQQRGFQYVHTPLITGSDGEGAGEMFAVSSILGKLDECLVKPQKAKGEAQAMADLALTQKKLEIDYAKDFFSKQAFLTVTGQLNEEAFAVGMGDCYTFGPTFRAEDSHTSRHLAEFWMIEPEITFSNLQDNINLGQDYLRYCTQFVLENCMPDLEFFQERIDKTLIERLRNVVENDLIVITYTKAIEILLQPEHLKAGNFSEKPYWGVDLGSEHERYLTEKVYKQPIALINYPTTFKAFYMRRNDEKVVVDGEEHETVQAMDLLVPKIGELIGGSVREERLEKLEEIMEAKGLDKENYNWYLDLRRYGSVPHSGFGVGFERLIMFATGVENIRDVIPFPRAAGLCEF